MIPKDEFMTLVVEDDPFIAMDVMAVFEDNGKKAVRAGSYKDAVKLWDDHGPSKIKDVIVDNDLGKGAPGGMDFHDYVRGNGGEDTLIILSSGSGSGDVLKGREDALVGKRFALLPKPFSSVLLTKLVAERPIWQGRPADPKGVAI